MSAAKNQAEVELKFLVPPAARLGITTEMARGSATLERMSLAAIYLDTDDRRLAQKGMAWRLRREGRRWIQTLKAGGTNALERFEHEVVRPEASHDASLHAGTRVGDQLIALLRRARADGVEPGVRFQTEVRRTARRVRTRGAIVEVAFDEGRLLAAGSTHRIREIEFELISGSTASMLALAERWRKRFGLIYDPRSKSERGDRLAGGSPFPPVRKAGQARYPEHANAAEAFGAVLDECLAQITRNAVGLIEGDPTLRVEHIHQLRVGIRRIRSALRSFQGWAPSPPAALVDGLRSLFATLGMSRDSDVLGGGVVAELAKVGAPPLKLPAGTAGPDPVEAVRTTDTQRTFLAWIAWRATLAEEPGEGVDAVVAEPRARKRAPRATPSPPMSGHPRGNLTPRSARRPNRRQVIRCLTMHRHFTAVSNAGCVDGIDASWPTGTRSTNSTKPACTLCASASSDNDTRLSSLRPCCAVGRSSAICRPWPRSRIEWANSTISS